MRHVGRVRIAILLAAVFLMSAFAGCGKEENDLTGSKAQTKGRYVEREMTLPEGVTAENIVGIGKEGNVLTLTVRREEEGMAVFSTYEYEAKTEAFTETTGEWLKQLEIPYEEYGNVIWQKGKNGEEFLYTVFKSQDSEEDYWLGHLYRTTDGKSAEEITPKSWQTFNEKYYYYEYPSSIVLQQETLIANLGNRLEYYQSEDGSLIRTREFSSPYGEEMKADGENLYLFSCSDMGIIKGIEVYEPGNDKAVNSIEISTNSSGSSYVDILEDKSFIYCCENGFYKYGVDGTQWEQIIPAAYTSLGRMDFWCKDMIALEDGSCYALFAGQNENGALMQYVYDEEMIIETTKVLKVYSIHESSILKQAAALFRTKHPEVIVEIETVLSFEDTLEDNINMTAICTALNGQLLAGEAADILVMDGLDIESYVEKGLLLDIGDTISPLEEQGELLENITAGYETGEGKRYVVPLRFGMTMVAARELEAGNLSDMKALAQALAAAQESVLGVRTVEDLTAQFTPFFMDEIIKGKELDQEKLKEYLELLKDIGNNCGVVQDYGEDMRGKNIWELPSEVKAAFYQTEGFNQAMLPLSAVKLVNGSYDCFADTFFPLFEAGIYSKTAEPELAKEFLAFALSQEVQNTDFYDGFPVNVKSLNYQAAQDRNDNKAVTMIDIGGGSYSEFVIDTYSEEEAQRLIEICKGLTKRAYTDSRIEQEIAAALPAYLSGEQSVEATIQKIYDSLNMYLAE